MYTHSSRHSRQAHTVEYKSAEKSENNVKEIERKSNNSAEDYTQFFLFFSLSLSLSLTLLFSYFLFFLYSFFTL
jgi:hypothetical protein